MMSNEDRPKCPECEAPLRDIEVAHIDSQLRDSIVSFGMHRLLLFCGHRVEVEIKDGAVVFRTLDKPEASA